MERLANSEALARVVFAVAALALASLPATALAQEAQPAAAAPEVDPGIALADALYARKYAIIAERKPFGPEPANFDPDTVVSSSSRGAGSDEEAAAQQEAQQLSEQENKLAGAVKITILNVGLDGAAYVGFTDSTVNPPRNYYIKSGDTRDEWRVVSVDEDKREATLEYSGASQKIELAFKLGGGLGGEKKSGDADGAPGVAAAVASGLAPALAGGSAAGRLRRRQNVQTEQLEAMRREREEADKRAKEEAARAAEDRAAMQEQLAALADGLRIEREERAREREREEAARREREAKGEPEPEEPDESGDEEN